MKGRKSKMNKLQEEIENRHLPEFGEWRCGNKL